MSIFKPLQIDFYLATDLVIQNQIHFDSLIQYFTIEENEDNNIFLSKLEENYPLPLRKIRIGQYWFWDCSNSIIKIIKTKQDTIKKRLCLDGLKKKNVNIAGTYYGIRMITFERKQVEFVRFFVYGNKERLNKILDRMINRNLGMYRAKGFGLIKDFEISKADMQYCFVCDNILLRDIPFHGEPFQYLTDEKVTIKKGRYRPPYFDMVEANDNRINLLCQGSSVNLAKINIQIL